MFLCMALFLLTCLLETFMQREMVADAHYCPVDKKKIKEKVENHKGTDVQWKGIGDLEVSYRAQR